MFAAAVCKLAESQSLVEITMLLCSQVGHHTHTHTHTLVHQLIHVGMAGITS